MNEQRTLEKAGSIPVQDKVTGVWRLDRIRAMEQVAPQMGLVVSIVASAGEDYPTSDGKSTAKVRKGEAYLEITKPEHEGESLNLTAFWEKVDAIVTPAYARLQKKVEAKNRRLFRK